MLKHNFKKAPEVKFRFPITTEYQWGRGWPEMDDADDFKEEIDLKLGGAGYVVKKSNQSGVCDTLTTKGNHPVMDVYMHPMEFSGIATPDDIQKIREVLQTCENVYHVGEASVEDLYLASESEYREMLCQNAPDIIKWMKTQREKNHSSDWTLVSDFCSRYRVNCIFHTAGIVTSSDVDYVFCETLQGLMKSLNL